jgi:phosphate-selective porin OprO/OprP
MLRAMLPLIVALVSPFATWAREAEPEATSATASLESVDQRLKVLERKLENAEEEAQNKAKTSTSATASEKGFGLKSADGEYELRFRALVQGDGRFFFDDEAPAFNETFVLRRLRPTLEGSLGKLVGFRLTPEFAGSSATIVDAYVDLRFHPAATLRVGKQKGPVGLERLQSGGSLMQIERAFPTELVPNRDIGVSLQGEVLSSRLTYALGVFNGVADGRDARATDVDDRKELEGRIFIEPFRSDPGFFQNLGLGISGSTGEKEGTSVGTEGVLPQYRTPGQNTFFQYVANVAANGAHDRWSVQGYFYRYGLGLLGEYVESKQAVALGAAEAELTHSAWQLTASYLLTGEDASYRGLARPNRPFKTGEVSWGAFELTARVEELDIDEDAFPVFASPTAAASKAFAYGVGVNWYLNANTRLVANYTLTEFEGGAAGGLDREDEKAFFMRLQLTF